MTDCAANAQVSVTLTPDPRSTDGSGATGALSCWHQIALGGGGSFPAPATAPVLQLLVPVPDGNADGLIEPDSTQIGYNATTGALEVSGYQAPSAADPEVLETVNFENGPQALDLTSCDPAADVLLSVYPIGDTQGGQAQGFLSCQAPPTLPYGLCASDPNATGGVVAALLTPPGTDGSGASFDLGCVCIPPYLGGPALDTAATVPQPDAASFWQTGQDDGEALGLMVGASTLNPLGRCVGEGAD